MPPLARRILFVCVALAVLAAACGGTYLVADPEGARAEGRKAGLDQGEASTAAIAEAKQADLTTFQNKMHESDLKGLRDQLVAARKANTARYKAGAVDALGEFGSPWEAGRAYIVTTKSDGPSGIGIATRGTIEQGTLYLLCGSNPTDLCTRPDPAY